MIDPALASDLVDRFSDVVQREREWAKSLADITQRAENLSTAKAEFLSNLSHELRTPLTVIKGVSQVVGKFGGADAAQASMMGQLEEAATKLTRMVENLLTLAEMERGEFGLDLQESDVAEITRETAEEVASRYPDVKLDLRVPPAIPATCDPERIREVLRHIIDNACRYSEESGVVMVQARRAVEGVVVSVQDSGKGLDRGLVRAAFGEAFSVGEQVLTKERSGLGLGLNLARRLVMQHGGILTADPLPGGGSKVSFVIPPEPEPAATAGNGHAPDAVEDDLLERLRILQRRLSDSESQAAT